MKSLSKWLILFLFLLLHKSSHAQNSAIDLNLLFEVLAQSTRNDGTATGEWVACGDISSFLQSDTIVLYNSTDYLQEAACCAYISWHFHTPTSFQQAAYAACEQHSANEDKPAAMEYTVQYKQEQFVKMQIMKAEVCVAVFKVAAIDRVELSNRSYCYQLILVKEH